jgi:hypothetical protein
MPKKVPPMNEHPFSHDLPARFIVPVPNATEHELTPYPGTDVLPINMQGLMTFVPKGVSVIEPGFNHVTLLASMGPLTETTYSVVLTLQATYERIRHLEAVVRAREEAAEHWESEAKALAVWKNETTPTNHKVTKLKITQTGKAEEYTGLPQVLHVYGEVRDERWFQESPHKREAKYVLVQDLTNDSPLQTWPNKLITAANELLRRLGAEPVRIAEDGSLSAKTFFERAEEAIVAQAEIETQCREAVGLSDTDDITLLERLREMTQPVPAENPDRNDVDWADQARMRSDSLEAIFRLVRLPGAQVPRSYETGLIVGSKIVPRVQELKTSYEQVLAERNDLAKRLSKYEAVEGNHLPAELVSWPEIEESPREPVQGDVEEPRPGEVEEPTPRPRRK